MAVILRLILRLPPDVRRVLKDKFPKLAQIVLTQSSNLKKWQLRQSWLGIEFDQKANALSVEPLVGHSSAKQQIVIVSPTAPTKNGITKYSANLVKELGEFLQVKIVTSFLEKGKFEFSPGVRYAFPEACNDLARREILYMLGNGQHHWRTWEMILQKPGYILIHDARIPDIPLFNEEDPIWYELDYSTKASKFLGRLPIHTKGIFTHSQHAANIVRQQLNNLQLELIPIHILETGHPINKVFGPRKLPQDRPIIGTFGFQTSNKNPKITYAVIAELAARTNGKGIICGQIDDFHRSLAKKYWLESGNQVADLEIYSWVSDVEYEKVMSRVDIGVQLRTSTNGESSGPFTQLTSRGVPTVVTDIGTFSEFPPYAGVFKLPQGIPEVDLPLLLSSCVELLESEQKYSHASRELTNFYHNKTYSDCAKEIYGEVFK
jgi:hypothetical protein